MSFDFERFLEYGKLDSFLDGSDDLKDGRFDFVYVSERTILEKILFQLGAELVPTSVVIRLTKC